MFELEVYDMKKYLIGLKSWFDGEEFDQRYIVTAFVFFMYRGLSHVMLLLM